MIIEVCLLLKKSVNKLISDHDRCSTGVSIVLLEYILVYLSFTPLSIIVQVQMLPWFTEYYKKVEYIIDRRCLPTTFMPSVDIPNQNCNLTNDPLCFILSCISALFFAIISSRTSFKLSFRSSRVVAMDASTSFKSCMDTLGLAERRRCRSRSDSFSSLRDLRTRWLLVWLLLLFLYRCCMELK